MVSAGSRHEFERSNAEGRLVTACKATNCAGTPDKVAFMYDGAGHRIRIVETPASGTPTTTDFAYEGPHVQHRRVRRDRQDELGPEFVTR